MIVDVLRNDLGRGVLNAMKAGIAASALADVESRVTDEVARAEAEALLDAKRIEWRDYLSADGLGFGA